MSPCTMPNEINITRLILWITGRDDTHLMSTRIDKHTLHLELLFYYLVICLELMKLSMTCSKNRKLLVLYKCKFKHLVISTVEMCLRDSQWLLHTIYFHLIVKLPPPTFLKVKQGQRNVSVSVSECRTDDLLSFWQRIGVKLPAGGDGAFVLSPRWYQCPAYSGINDPHR